MIRLCKECGKEFEAIGTASYCSRIHVRKCEVCGSAFSWDYKNPRRCCNKSCSRILRKMSIASTPKVCKLCGEKFTPQNNSQQYCKRDHFAPCPICGTPVKLKELYATVPCCSKECSTQLRKQTCLSTYGVPVASQHPSVRLALHESAVAAEPARKLASLRNWGVDNPAKHPDVKAKISSTVRGEDCQSRTKATNILRYGSTHIMKTQLGIDRFSKTSQELYDVPFFCMTDACKLSQGNIISSLNREFGHTLSKNSICYKFEFKLSRFSYDLVVPSLNLLIEINPTYTHNVVGNHWGSGIDKYYHQYKSKLAEEHGFRCIHVFDWMDTSEVVKWILSFDKLKFSEIHEPELHFSKGTEVIQVVDPEDQHRLIEAGWLPVYDAGQSISLQ